LWAQGKSDAAMQREHLWNELAETYGVDIRCACVLGTGEQEQNKETIERIRAQHADVHFR